MKKLIALLLIVTIVGCKKKEEPQPEPEPTPAPVAVADKTLNMSFVSNLDGTLSVVWNYNCSGPNVTNTYVIDPFSTPGSKVVPGTADSLYFSFAATNTVLTCSYNYSFNAGPGTLQTGGSNTTYTKYLKY